MHVQDIGRLTCDAFLPNGDLVTPMIITLSSGFIVFTILGRAFFTLLGSDCSHNGVKMEAMD